MTNTCRQVIKMITEKNKKSLITPPSVKACVIIMIIGIGISTWGYLENQSIYVIIGIILYISSIVYGSRYPKNIDNPMIHREIKEDIILELQRLNLRDRTSIEQLEKEIEQHQIKEEKSYKGLTKGGLSILSVSLSIFFGGKFFESLITSQNSILVLMLVFCIISAMVGYYIIIYSLCQIIKAIMDQYNKYKIAYTWLEEIKYTVK